MRWPFVWRSSLEAVQATLAGVSEVRWDVQARMVRAEQERDAALRRASALDEADAARIRAEVRASEWEAIARELIARGAGRPRPEQAEKPESPLAKKIREESGGDPMIQAHYWKNVVAPARAAGKKDEEIADLIGWETQDPPAQ